MTFYPQFAKGSKKAKKRHDLLDVLTGNIPSAPAVAKPRETLKSFTEAYNREQAEIAQRPIREAQAKFDALQEEANKTLRELNNDIRAFWSQPLSELNPKNAVVDSIGEYTLGERLTPEVEKEVSDTFFIGIAGNKIILTPEAAQKLGAFFQSLVRRLGVEYSLANLVAALDRLVTLGVFKEGRDITGYSEYERKPVAKSVPQPVAQPKPNLDALSTDSREWRDSVGSQWGDEFAKIFSL